MGRVRCRLREEKEKGAVRERTKSRACADVCGKHHLTRTAHGRHRDTSEAMIWQSTSFFRYVCMVDKMSENMVDDV